MGPTRGDLDDGVTPNYPKPLCRCESRREKMNYYFQLRLAKRPTYFPSMRLCSRHADRSRVTRQEAPAQMFA